jgi:D-cysteine desulfhydrase
LRCQLVIEQRVRNSYRADASGNNFLFGLLGVEALHVVDAGDDLSAAMEAVAHKLETEGRRGYIIPGGGSNPLGALGYVACAQEIMNQSFDMSVPFDHVVCASGSAGTHAGLLVGFTAANYHAHLTGINVRRSRAEQEFNVYALAASTAALLGTSAPTHESIRALDEWVGAGYSLPSQEMIDAVHMLARVEGILLDPVYTGKAMAGLIGLVDRGYFRKGERVLFVHTGGSPALYAYQRELTA